METAKEEQISSAHTRTSTVTNKNVARLPWGTKFWNHVRLFNPLVWSGIFELFHTLGVWNLHDIFRRLVLRVALPGCLWTMTLVASATTAISPTTAATLFFLSPWSISSIAPILPSLSFGVQILSSWRTSRCPALPSAIESLEERIQQNRAYRRCRYDVYLPPTLQSTSSSTTTTTALGQDDKYAEENNSSDNSINRKAIVLIPGGLVEHTAYSEVAGRLADAGLLTVVLSLEPTRVGHAHAGADWGSIQKVMKQITTANNFHIDEWILVGHSAGSAGALQLLEEAYKYYDLDNQKKNKRSNKRKKWNHNVTVNKAVLWARGNSPIPDALKNISIQPPPAILVIQGGNDPILNKGDRQAVSLSLPKNNNSPLQLSMEIVLKGGSHQQFGSYKRVFNPFYQGVMAIDEATISRQEQQDLVADLTATFCQGKKPVYNTN